MYPPDFAFVRSLKTSAGSNLRTFQQIVSAETHAKRQDLTSNRRQAEGRSHSANYFWSKAGTGLNGGGADYTAAYRQHKADHGIKTERKNAALGQHLLVGVSEMWLRGTGDPRDINNPRVVQLIDEAKKWAESWMGEGAVWAVRYDTDETGSGVVDILASPIRQQQHRSGASKPAISVRKTNAELAAKHGVIKSWEAMQTDWALHAQSKLDPSLKRGIPKAETDREHLNPDAYSAAVEDAVAVLLKHETKQRDDIISKADEIYGTAHEEGYQEGIADSDWRIEQADREAEITISAANEKLARANEKLAHAESRFIEAQEILTDARKVHSEARAAGEREGRSEGLEIALKEVAGEKTQLEKLRRGLEKRQERIEEWISSNLGTREAFYERGFAVLTNALRKTFNAASFEKMAKAYETELKATVPPEKAQSLPSSLPKSPESRSGPSR